MSELAKNTGQELQAFDDESIMSALSNSVYPGAKMESVSMVIAYCKAAQLDPIQKPVHIVPMSVKNQSGDYIWRDVVMPGIGLYRTMAARTGQYAGMSEPEYGPDITENIGGVDITYPEWCRVTVNRLVGGHIAPFPAKERWKENYAVRGGKQKSIAPNSMWMKRPYAQLAKCAEAQALRKAFPEVGSQPTAEEMEGKVIGEDSYQDQEVKTNEFTPQSKSKAKQEEVLEGELVTDSAPKQDGPPATEGMKKMLRAKLSAASIAESEFEEKFGFGVEDMKGNFINNALSWVKEQASA